MKSIGEIGRQLKAAVLDIVENKASLHQAVQLAKEREKLLKSRKLKAKKDE